MGGLLLTSQAVIAKNYVIGAPMNFMDKWQTYLLMPFRFWWKHDDVQIKLADSNSDPNIQVNLVQNFIDQNVDALLVVPTDPTVVKRIGVKVSKKKRAFL